jgi:hypothetical protein
MESKFDILFEEIQNSFEIEKTAEPCECCEVCGKEFDEKNGFYKFIVNGPEELEVQLPNTEPVLISADDTAVCLACAECIAEDFSEAVEAGTIEITADGKPYDLWKSCTSCGSLYPENELKNTNHGDICEYCVDGLISHGEHISVNY